MQNEKKLIAMKVSEYIKGLVEVMKDAGDIEIEQVFELNNIVYAYDEEGNEYQGYYWLDRPDKK